jgi:hypothetical protein
LNRPPAVSLARRSGDDIPVTARRPVELQLDPADEIRDCLGSESGFDQNAPVTPATGLPGTRLTLPGVFVAAATAADGAEIALLEPYEFAAITARRIVEPMSDATSLQLDAVPPGIAAQFAPAASQRSHWCGRFGACRRGRTASTCWPKREFRV